MKDLYSRKYRLKQKNKEFDKIIELTSATLIMILVMIISLILII